MAELVAGPASSAGGGVGGLALTLEAHAFAPGGGFGNAEFARCAAELLDGLAFLHDRGVAHRGLRPGSALVDGRSRRVRLRLDRGLDGAGWTQAASEAMEPYSVRVSAVQPSRSTDRGKLCVWRRRRRRRR